MLGAAEGFNLGFLTRHNNQQRSGVKNQNHVCSSPCRHTVRGRERGELCRCRAHKAVMDSSGTSGACVSAFYLQIYKN